MLEQEEAVTDDAGRSLVDQPPLERVGLAIVDPTQPASVQRCTGVRFLQGSTDEGRLHAGTIAGSQESAGDSAGESSHRPATRE
jgi:hypothetical protein